MFNDSISDLLTRIRNANTARKRNVVMPYSKMKAQVAEILAANGFLRILLALLLFTAELLVGLAVARHGHDGWTGRDADAAAQHQQGS